MMKREAEYCADLRERHEEVSGRGGNPGARRSHLRTRDIPLLAFPPPLAGGKSTSKASTFGGRPCTVTAYTCGFL